MADIEFHGTQLINQFPKYSANDPGLAKVIDRLFKLHLIDEQTYYTLQELRELRNQLAHHPTKYLNFDEIKLYEFEHHSKMILNFVMQKLHELSHNDTKL
ncbi:MAG: hypothetical protein GY845_09670 [Planctomycetes bacterium]|nr:hypothetical protein [Planctomycetota bacterium]